jgi:Holliday junction resolvase RusA-like endonuclease
MILEFTVNAPPTGKERPRFDSRNNRTYTPSKTRDYEQMVSWAYRAKHGGIQLEGTIGIAITAYYPIPASWSNVKKERAVCGEIRPTVTPDGDNIAKAICDSLNKVAYKDDAAIVELKVTKAYSLHPRVEVILNGNLKEGDL